MIDFLSEFVEAMVNIGLVAFVGRWVADRMTLASAKHIAFALALGVAIGRNQVSIVVSEVSDLERSGAALGAMTVLGLLWFYWFKVSAEKVDG